MIDDLRDLCECGDYRHQHQNGEGRCLLGSLCTPTPCSKFRLFRRAGSDETAAAVRQAIDIAFSGETP